MSYIKLGDCIFPPLTQNDIDFQKYVIGYIEREQKKRPDDNLNFQNIYHRLNILTREAIHGYAMGRAEIIKGKNILEDDE